MLPRRALRLLLSSLLAAAVLVAAGCGEQGDEGRKALEEGRSAGGIREGLAVPVNGVEYNVFITRELNLKDPEDQEYYHGPEAPPGSSLYGIFIQACNPRRSKATRTTTSEFSVQDTEGHTFQPIPVPQPNPFAYQPATLPPGVCEPSASSASYFGPTGGHMLLFKIPVSAGENRPLSLQIKGPYDPAKQTQQVARITLDI